MVDSIYPLDTFGVDIGTSNSLYPSATAITNLEYEQALQDKKRKIKERTPLEFKKE